MAYIGKILRIDLETKKSSVEDVSSEDAEKYIGGAGVGAAIFTREVPPETDAYDSNNLIIFSVGPYTGTTVPCNGRHFVCAKSPLTGMMGEASSGGFFGKELKCAGFDHVIIWGKSEKPVYLWIKDGVLEIKDASKIWGKGTRDTELGIKAELGDDKVRIASIGPAGENLVRFAAIMNEEDRAAGRCGLGAVMGSKNLKAIAVRGTGKAPVEDPDALKEATGKLREELKTSLFAGVLNDYGTPAGYSNESQGYVPIKNYSMSRWKGNKKIDHEVLKARNPKKHACFGCPIACTGMLEYEGRLVRWPEYETLAQLGSNLMVDDLDAIIRWNVIANDLGMDTISLGACLASLLECAEKKLLDIDFDASGFKRSSEKETFGQYEPWGNVEAIEKLINMIATREGIGNDLAEGIKRFVEARKLPEDMDTTGKGMEAPGIDPRWNDITALSYATEPRGAFHCHSPHGQTSNMNLKMELGLDHIIDRFSSYSQTKGMSGFDETVQSVVKMQDTSEAYSAGGACIWGLQCVHVITPWIESLNAITGREYDLKSWLTAGEKIFNLKRTYNLSCGMTKKDDDLGKRFYMRILKGGTKKHVPPFSKLLPRYYDFRGWTQDGVPTDQSWVARPKIRKRRVLDYVADMLEEAGITRVFALPGGITPFFVEELYKRPETFDVTITAHESAAAVMADVYGRMQRKPALVVGQGVWMATNGGFGIVEAFYAGVPMVIITEFSDWYGINQFGSYQLANGEYGAVDARNIYQAMCKQVFVVTEPHEFYYAVQLAIKHAISGRPGPTCVITKWNSMIGIIDDPRAIDPYPFQSLKGYLNVKPPTITDEDAITMAEMLVNAESPVMICGRGTHASNAYEEVEKLALLLGIPVATTYMGKSIVPENHDLAVGSIGAIGQKLANTVVGDADVILAVGTCLAPDNTKNCSFDFINPKFQKILQIDIEPRNAGWTYPLTLGVTSDAKLGLRKVIGKIKNMKPKVDVKARINKILEMKADEEMEFYWSKFFFKEKLPMDPERIVKSVNELIRDDDLLMLDAGNNRMWFTKLFQTKKASQLIGPGGAAGMGWVASAILSAQMQKEKGKAIGIIGDGGMLMMLYCLEMAKNFKLPVIYVVMNNSSLGNPRDYLTTRGRKMLDYEDTDFAAIASSMGLEAKRVTDFVDFEDAFKVALESEKPFLIDVIVKKANHDRLTTL